MANNGTHELVFAGQVIDDFFPAVHQYFYEWSESSSIYYVRGQGEVYLRLL